jgi:hypothetical protein
LRGLVLWLTCNGERYCISKDIFTIGGSRESDVRIEGPDVKPVEAIIERIGGVFLLYDFSAASDTKKTGVGVAERLVRHGETLRVRHFDLGFAFGWCGETCPRES